MVRLPHHCLAEQGDANAQFLLGSIYSRGLGVEKDDQKAVEWYRKAAEQGHAPSMASLAFSYKEGAGVVKDEETALAWAYLAKAHATSEADLVYSGNLITDLETQLSREESLRARESARMLI